MKLSIEDGTIGYNGRPILKGVSLHLNEGEIVGILGPNGIGKTTIFRSMLGTLRLIDGKCLLDGTYIEKYSARDFAKLVGYVPQAHEATFPYTVVDVIIMGRTAHLKPFQTPSSRDYKIVNEVMQQLEISYLKSSNYAQISGGEQQMVLVARALAQQPHFLMMDEPTANLDFGNQIRVLSCIRNLAGYGLGVLMTTHNPDHVFLCCDRVILLTKDKRVIEGPVDEVITEKNLLLAYGVDVKISKVACPDGRIIKSCVPLLNSNEYLGGSFHEEN